MTPPPVVPDAVATDGASEQACAVPPLENAQRFVSANADLPDDDVLAVRDIDKPHSWQRTVLRMAGLRALCALAEQGMAWERMFTDEQAAHKLTAETLTKAIRDGDKAEQYRVERDKARRALREILGAWDAMDATDPNAETTTEEYTRAFDAVLNRGRAATQEVPDAE